MQNILIDKDRLLHSIKTVIACALAFLFIQILLIPNSQWVVITVTVVMCGQIYVGSVLQKAYLRFIGTCIGCLFAILAILMVGHSMVAIILAISVSNFIFSYLATGKENLVYAGTLGAITTTIIMFDPHPSFALAIGRLLEISLGILIAAFVSQFFFPIHARTYLLRAQIETLRQLRDYYIVLETAFIAQTSELSRDEQIIQSLLKQRQLAKDCKKELLGIHFDQEHFTKLLTLERTMLRSITFMHEALQHVDPKKFNLAIAAAFRVFSKDFILAINKIIAVIEKKESKDSPIPIPNVLLLKAEIDRHEILPREQIIYVDGFLLAAEMVANCLDKIKDLYSATR